MKIKFTDAVLKTLAREPGKQQSVYWDTRTPGFGVVVGNTKAFVARAYSNGKQHRVTLGKFPELTTEAARAAALTTLGKMASGVNPVAEKRRADGPTLREALKYHVERMERGENRRRKPCSPGSIETLRRTIEIHLEPYLDEALVLLTADELDKVRAHIETTTRRQRTSAVNAPGRATANRLLANVSVVWNSWDKRHGLPVPNPVKRLTPAALKPRSERVSNDELPAWYQKVQALSPIRRDLQLVSMFSSVREDGLRHLRHEDVDLAEGLLHITRAKGDKPYTLPLTKTLREILERRKKENEDVANDVGKYLAPYGGDGGWVFPSVSRDGKRVIPIAETKERKIVRDKDGKKHLVRHLPGTHANRRTYNSIAIEIGIPPEVRETLMNHEGRGVNVRHYGRPENWNYLAKQAQKIEGELWKRIEASQQKPRLR